MGIYTVHTKLHRCQKMLLVNWNFWRQTFWANLQIDLEYIQVNYNHPLPNDNCSSL